MALPTTNVTEKDFQDLLLAVARRAGWTSYHTHDSRRSQPGFPDLVLVRPPKRADQKGELLFIELKTDTGRLTHDQQRWLSLLELAGAEVHLWRPADTEQCVDRLTRR